MTGITKEAIDEYCQDEKIDIWTLYERLYNKEEIEFNLLAGQRITTKKTGKF